MIVPKEMKKLREENTKLKNELRKSKYIDTKILKKWKNDFEKKMLKKVQDAFHESKDDKNVKEVAE